MKAKIASALLFCAVCLQAAYHDHTFRSRLFNEDRSFRVYTGASFDSSGATRYPVIYYCHGCQGSYLGDQYASYNTGGYTHPYCESGCASNLRKPFNADFQMFTDSHDVIIVMIDGRINVGGCNVWYPFDQSGGTWAGNEFRFDLHLRELFRVVDSLYPTRAEPRYRGVSGLSMGGHSSLWISACNQHLVRSMSSFCHSPIYFRTGGPGYTTCVDVTQLWRNYRALFTRTSANSGDYIYGRSYDLSCRLDGGTLGHEYHLNDFWRHWAAHVDSQFIFHMNSFNTPVVRPPCFSHISLFPSFDVWGYDVSSSKKDSGWIYLKDATPSSFALITRKWIPFGAAMEPFAVTVKTPPLYAAGTPYTVNRYHYRTGAFSSASAQADAGGRLTLSCAGGMGEEIAIQGSGLRAALALLTDTLFENITLRMDRDTVISGDVVNLSNASITGASVQVTSAGPVVTVLSGPRMLPAMAARSRLHLDTLAILRGTVLPDTAESLAVYFWREKSTGFIKARFRGAGLDTAREQLMQVDVAREIPYLDSMDVRVFDGRDLSDLPVFRASGWGGVNPNEITYPFISEGSGNGDGVPDSGEAFSVWVRLRQGLTSNDSNTWHPAVCVNGMGQPGVVYLGNTLYLWDRSRTVISGLYRLTRAPTDSQPLDLILRTEILNTYPGGAQNIDVSAFRYIKVRLPLTQGIGVERGVASGPGRASLRVFPNPFNPVTRIEFALPPETASPAALVIFDVKGRMVRAFRGTALRKVLWDRTDGSGRAVAAGVYVIQLISGNTRLQARAVLLP